MIDLMRLLNVNFEFDISWEYFWAVNLVSWNMIEKYFRTSSRGVTAKFDHLY